MLTTKKRETVQSLVVLLSGVFLGACRPSGPDALLEGERLIHAQNYREAIEQLVIATRLLPDNAQAWNHLGLASHGAGDFAQAAHAYQQALQRNPNLAVAYFNSGTLALEQNDPLTAITNFTKFIVWQRGSAEGWLKLGAAQLRAGQSDAAEKSLHAALKLQPGQAEALNGLGVVQAQRRRPREAITHFTNALQAQPNYGPAMLNLAIVTYAFDPRSAAQWFKNYLVVHPTAPNATPVREMIRQLETALIPSQKPLTNPVTEQPTARANSSPGLRTAANIQPASPPTNFVREPTAQVHTQQLAKVELPTPKAESSTPPPVKSPEPKPEPQEIRVTMDVPVTKTVTDVSPPPSTLANVPPALADSESPSSSSTTQPERAVNAEPRSTQPEEKRSLADRLNPANWFTRSKPPPITTLLDSNSRRAAQASSPPRTNLIAQPISTPKASSESSPKKEEPANNLPAPWPRYSYHSPEKPIPGDRARALDAVARGVESHRQRKLSDAVQAYREAAQLDPSFFEAQYNLGLAAYELKSWPSSLSAYETALSINPTSTNARFNFAVVLERAGYPLDAADQLEKLINQQPNETRAHFSLARISAEQLNRPSAAIRHYQKVLELEPQHPQASAIRQWLLAQPLR